MLANGASSMPAGPNQPWLTNPSSGPRGAGLSTNAIRPTVSALLFGIRLWAAVCLALYIAYWLELDNVHWAGASAALVCQPSLGASLRKGSFLMIGTVIGAVAIVVLTAIFPQSRTGFLLGLAVWAAACGFAASILRHTAYFAPALAGYTAMVIASGILGATGGASGEVFMLAITRASEICIGIVSAGIILAGSDFGNARHRLAGQFATLAAEITEALLATFLSPGPSQAETRPPRRRLVGRVVALGSVIEEVVGETPYLRYRQRALQIAENGLFAALSGWRTVANCLEHLPDDQGREEAEAIRLVLPQEFLAGRTQVAASTWMSDPLYLRRACLATVRVLVNTPASTPSLRLMADGTAHALLGMSRMLDGLALLADPSRPVPRRGTTQIRMPDLLPGLINAMRALVTVIAVELFWIATAWPNGATALSFAALGVILISPREGQAYAGAKTFFLGISLAAVLAGLIKFAVLPNEYTFAEFSIVIGLVLVPIGALSAQSWQGPVFAAMATWFIFLLAPTNQMNYDTLQFYNTTLSIVTGTGTAMLAMVLIPPLSPVWRTRRILARVLRDLRRLAAGRLPSEAIAWEGRMYSHLSVLPMQAEQLQLARLVAALSIGTEIIRLRRAASRFNLGPDVDAALMALAKGDGATTIRGLMQIDNQLVALPDARPGGFTRLRARGNICAISEALTLHASYFWQEPSDEIH